MAKRKKSRKQGKKSSASRKPRKTRNARAAQLAATSTTFVDPSAPPPPPPPQPAASVPAPALPARASQPRSPRKAAPSAHGLMATEPRPARSERPVAPARPAQPFRHGLPAQPEKLSMSQIYETLAALLVPYARKMESEMHPKIGFCLKSRSPKTGREVHFGGVQAQPDGVAYHLFPLYAHPDLLQNVSPELHERMRGQTCFHFEDLHAGLVAELAELTHLGFERFVADGQV